MFLNQSNPARLPGRAGGLPVYLVLPRGTEERMALSKIAEPFVSWLFRTSREKHVFFINGLVHQEAMSKRPFMAYGANITRECF